MYKKYDIENFSSSDNTSTSPSPGGNTNEEIMQDNQRINEKMMKFMRKI